MLQESTSSNQTLKQFALPAYFCPQLAVHMVSAKSADTSTTPAQDKVRRPRTQRVVSFCVTYFPHIFSLILLLLIFTLGSEIRQLRDALEGGSRSEEGFTRHFWWTSNDGTTTTTQTMQEPTTPPVMTFAPNDRWAKPTALAQTEPPSAPGRIKDSVTQVLIPFKEIIRDFSPLEALAFMWTMIWRAFHFPLEP